MSSVILLTVILGVLHSGASLECYICDLETEPACGVTLNGKVPHYTCGVAPTHSNTGLSGDSLLSRNLPLNFQGNENSRPEDFHCLKATATNRIVSGVNYTGIIRTCALRTLSCAVFERGLQEKGFASVRCDTCTTDLCNGNSTLTATIFITMLSVLLSFITSG